MAKDVQVAYGFEDMEKMRKVDVKPSIFTESVYLIEGKPFKFTGRNYLKTIYDTDITYGLLKTGRQVEKSTTLSIKMANDILLKSFTRDLYVAPMNEQVKTFSKDRLSKLFRYSKENVVRRFYMSSDLSEQVYMRQFTNGSAVWLRHCFGEGDNIRGLSIDSLYIDEIQDILTDAIPVIKETQFASDNPSTWFTGTPKTYSNTIEGLWQTSTQNEWVVKCSHCGCYQILSIKNIRPDFLRCRKCDGVITTEDIGKGFWEEMRPGNALKGFHISQMMSPRATMTSPSGGGVYQKMMNYSTGKFYNEVLGLSYETADKLITDVMLDSIMDNDETFYHRVPDKFALYPTFMGVDWGTGETSYTVVTIYVMLPDGKFQLLYCKKYDQREEVEIDEQVRHISQLINLYDIKQTVIDWGFGFNQAQKLRKIFGNKVAVCYYAASQRDKIKYDEEKEHFVVRRTDVIMDYVTECIHNRRCIWPGRERDALQFMREHHLVEQAEYRKTLNGRSEELYLSHPYGCPDDALHSSVYAFLAHNLYQGGIGNVRALNRAENEDFEFITVHR